MESTAYKCSDCGRDLSDITDESKPGERLPCPDCGSTIRKIFVELPTVRVGCSPSVSTKTKDPTGFVKNESRSKRSHSEKTGKPVTTTVEIDRSNPDVTKKHHKVEELDEYGIPYKTIHEHTDESKAKRRK